MRIPPSIFSEDANYLSKREKQLVQNINLKTDTIFGLYPCVLTGKVKDGLVQVFMRGNFDIYCRVSMSFGWTHIPSEKWLKKHAKTTRAWVGFEEGNPDRPVIVGFFKIGKSLADYTDFPESATFETEQFTITVNDTKKEVLIEQLEGGKQKFGIKERKIFVESEDINLSVESPDYKAVLGEKIKSLLETLVEDLGNLSALPTPAGPSGPLKSSPNFALLQANFESKKAEILSKIVKLN